jgi:TolB protein
MKRIPVTIGAIGAMACLVALGSIMPAAAVPEPATMAAGGVEAPASAIPWGEVGPGWFVALWGPHAAYAGGPGTEDWDRQTTTLYLVDPLGGRYRVTTWPAPSFYSLLDWSGDGRRVLVSTPQTGKRGAFEVESLDLADGKVLTSFPRDNASAGAYEFTRPDGLAILSLSSGARPGEPPSIVRLALSGTPEFTYPNAYPGVGALPQYSAGFLPSLDGTQLVVAASKGMAFIANNGTFIRDVGPKARTCTPVQWWGTTDLVASCYTARSLAAALWLVPTNGGTASQLTFPKPPDLGDLNGWRVGGSVYVQAAGACGTEFLAKRDSDGATEQVLVPGTENDVRVVGAHGSQLALMAVLACGTGRSLLWFDPANDKETPLLGTPLNAGGVMAALPYPGLES